MSCGQQEQIDVTHLGSNRPELLHSKDVFEHRMRSLGYRNSITRLPVQEHIAPKHGVIAECRPCVDLVECGTPVERVVMVEQWVMDHESRPLWLKSVMLAVTVVGILLALSFGVVSASFSLVGR
jgi:hypothetical protein